LSWSAAAHPHSFISLQSEPVVEGWSARAPLKCAGRWILSWSAAAHPHSFISLQSEPVVEGWSARAPLKC
ncbi:hypothetical protein C0U44_32275, partial [Klebsiella pneumoniae]